MKRTARTWSRLSATALFLVIGLLMAVPAASATVSVSRAELSGTRLRIEGTASPNAAITVDGVAMGTSDANGNFKIEKDPFAKPDDCIVDVNDGSASPTPAKLSGCTVDQPPGGTGSISIVPGGNGNGTIVSTPAGINCVINPSTGGSGTCWSFFPAGTVVRLDAKPAANSKFLGWRGLPGCSDPSKITVVANTTIYCQPAFALR